MNSLRHIIFALSSPNLAQISIQMSYDEVFGNILILKTGIVFLNILCEKVSVEVLTHESCNTQRAVV